MKKLFSLLLILCILLSLCACKKNDATIVVQDPPPPTVSGNTPPIPSFSSPSEPGPGFDENGKILDTVYVKMTVKDYGEIYLELDGKTAPITVANFVKLVNEGFYNGLTFHRAISEFVIQGGDPKGNGTGGSPNSIVGEFSDNGYNNTIHHERGVISMARSNSYNSASSQFFICNDSNQSLSNLDGKYAAFGHVISGMDVVDLITSSTSLYGDYNGIISDKSLQAVITEVKVVSPEEIPTERVPTQPTYEGPGFDENGKILDTVYVKMTVKDYGEIYLELDGKTAPVTVSNFVNLVNNGFYNGLTFHRVISGFMIQGGDPNGNGMGGSSDKIFGEFSANGYNNTIRHERGVISMARSNSYNSASSQFFICNATNETVSQLDGNYAAFGHVISGMNVVDLITSSTAQHGSYFTGTISDKSLQAVITEVKVISSEEALG